MITIDGNSINANYYNKGFSWLSIEWLVLSNIAAWATDESCLKNKMTIKSCFHIVSVTLRS